jgi:hypothetical protein
VPVNHWLGTQLSEFHVLYAMLLLFVLDSWLYAVCHDVKSSRQWLFVKIMAVCCHPGAVGLVVMD